MLPCGMNMNASLEDQVSKLANVKDADEDLVAKQDKAQHMIGLDCFITTHDWGIFIFLPSTYVVS